MVHKSQGDVMAEQNIMSSVDDTLKWTKEIGTPKDLA